MFEFICFIYVLASFKNDIKIRIVRGVNVLMARVKGKGKIKGG